MMSSRRPSLALQLVDIERPHEVINQHKKWMEGRNVRGRIYISEQVRF